MIKSYCSKSNTDNLKIRNQDDWGEKNALLHLKFMDSDSAFKLLH